ncbi:WD repeat-containing and planar cell polarity effector protein fritz isoform X2 [Orussus abietinus]|uniref:WD repeat-containing and planar cell polarity effector protein fritz isoform X2 n=1 Tax=Orussus abietinus TaxID=222816 RepID=UPI000626B17B|nr:WD repeat-containing and planar cell polarity effector protein fritz isoform X2 [Orussus abietinus]
MLILLGEVHLWTFDDTVIIKDTDFGAFRYHEKRINSLYEEGKRLYCQKRSMVFTPQNKKGNRLKDAIKYLEEQLKDNSVLYLQWHDHCIIHAMLSSGLLIQLQINIPTGDVQKIIFDKYLVGKVSDHISDVMITKNHLICTYNDSQITLVHFTKPRRHVFEKIGRLDPKLITVDLSGPCGRRLDKKIEVNKTGDLILIWWKSTMNEVYPWSPTVKEHDRANVHLYRLTGVKVELLCYLRTELDPLCIIFDTYHDNVLHSVEQKVSRKGEVTIEWRTYEVSQQDKLQRIAIISVPLPTHTSCVKFSPNHDMLLLCCIDGSITLHDQTKGTSSSIKTAFIPTLASWHNDGMIFAIGNERGQFQHFDISLSCIRSQMLSEDTTSANILDLSTYFRSQPALLRMEWNKKIDAASYLDHYYNGDSLFLLLFERGPLGVIRIVEGENLSGDVLIHKHLSLSQVERATSLLLFMNWDIHPRACMHSLNQILNYLFKLPLTPERESLIQNALGSFHVPVRPISQTIEEEYGDEVRDLTRRFFHHLLRYKLFEKAFRLAIDLNDHDLFMDIHFYALVMNDMEMATAAKEKAEQILSRSNSCSSSHSTCSRPSCSLCSGSASDKENASYSDGSETEDSRHEDRTDLSSRQPFIRNTSSQVPPLPVLHPSLYSSSGLMSTSFTDATASLNPVDSNLMTTPFNVPTTGLTGTICDSTAHNLVPSDLLPTTSFSKLPYKPVLNFVPIAPTSSVGNCQPLNSVSTSLTNVSYGNLSLCALKSVSLSHLKCNHSASDLIQSSLTRTSNVSGVVTGTSFQSNSFVSTPFNDPTYESVSMDVPPSFSSVTPEGDSTVENKSEIGAQPSSKYSRSTDVSCGALVSDSDALIETTAAFNNVDTGYTVLPFYNSGSNLMSTSFNDPDDSTSDQYEKGSTYSSTLDNISDSSSFQHLGKAPHSMTTKKHAEVPPPPSITNSFASYTHNLPKKNYTLSRNSTTRTDTEDPTLKFQVSGTANSVPQIPRRDNSTTKVNHGQIKNNFHPTRTYRLNYDLDYVPFHGSCDNLSDQYLTNSHAKSGSVSSMNHLHCNYNVQCKPLEIKPFRLGISQNSGSALSCKESKMSSNVPPLPIINPSLPNTKALPHCLPPVDTPSMSTEKPKVKFSDTVTHILVPGMGQAYRPVPKRPTTHLHPMDPKRELAESLPLCLGNEDYLKDFQPLSKDIDVEKAKEPVKTEEAGKIKVVHFGLL